MKDYKNIVVNIYCLYNPLTLKIRYIGRTSCKLNKRLNEHIHSAKKHLDKNTKCARSHKVNWIYSLLKNGIRPKIRLLTTVVGWEKSHSIEKDLIDKHLIKHNLVNGDDRGPGHTGAKNLCPINNKIRINKLKEIYSVEENKTNFFNKIYSYDLEGTFVKEYKSVKFAAIELGVNKELISNYMNSLKYGKQRKPVKDFYFSHTKYDNYPFLRPTVCLNRIAIKLDNVLYPNLKVLAEQFNLSKWDKRQLSKQIYTEKIKEVFKDKHIIMYKNGKAVLERNF